MSSLDTCASSDVEVDIGAEGSDEDYCEELHPEEEVTLDVRQSSRTHPLPKAGAPATGPPATDPTCRSNEPSCRLADQRSMLAWLPSAGAPKPRSATNETTKKRRDDKRQRDVEQAAASPTTPARAAHIEKPRAIRRHNGRRMRTMNKTRRSTRKMVWQRSENKACDDTLASVSTPGTGSETTRAPSCVAPSESSRLRDSSTLLT